MPNQFGFIILPLLFLYIKCGKLRKYIVEDRAIKSSQTCKVAQWIQQNILQELRGVVGGARTLPETVAHDLILQVFITNNTKKLTSHYQ